MLLGVTMKKIPMKTIIYLSLVFISFAANAQTAIIAHKSHAGTAHSYINTNGNFGVVMITQTEVTKINDTTVVLNSYKTNSNRLFYSDTIHEHPYYFSPTITVDSLQKLEPSIQFNGFNEQLPIQQKMDTVIKSVEKPTIQISKKTKKKSSFWLMYVVIGGALASFFVHYQTNIIAVAEE